MMYTYIDTLWLQAKEAVGAAQQKASEALGSAKETLTGAVRLRSGCSSSLLSMFCTSASILAGQ